MKYDFENKPRRSFFGLGVWIIIIVLGLGAVAGVGSWALNLASQPARVVTKTFDADNMIYNYEWFKQQYNDILAMDSKISNAQAQLDGWISGSPERSEWKIQDRQMYGQLNSIVLGLTNQRATMVATYNARAEMANRSIFMRDVPSHID